jgi:YggT family protein
MIALANLLNAISTILSSLIGFFTILVIARVVISWVNADPYNPLVRIIINSTEPLLRPIQKRIPARFGNIDLTPIILILILAFIDQFLAQSLRDYALSMRMNALVQN